MYIDLNHQIAIKGKPEDIYRAITTGTGVKTWWTTDVKIDKKAGGSAVFGFDDHKNVFEMTILELEANKKVLWESTGGTEAEWIGTMLEFEIGEPNENGVVDLKFSHSGWEAEANTCAMCNTTWGYLLVNLKNVIETGKASPYFK